MGSVTPPADWLVLDWMMVVALGWLAVGVVGVAALRRLAFVAHSQADLVAYRPQAQEVARYCQRWGMRYEEILGSDAYVRRLVEVAMALDTRDTGFVVIPPGGELCQAMFLGQE